MLTHIIAITEYDEDEKHSCRVKIKRKSLDQAMKDLEEGIQEGKYSFLHYTGDYYLKALDSYDEDMTNSDHADPCWNIYYID